MSRTSIRSGKLDRRIRIERDGAPVHDGYRQTPGAPVVLAARWAEYLPGSGSEPFEDAAKQAEVDAVFRIRWDAALDPNRTGEPPGINPRDRVRFPATEDGHLYGIVRAVEIGRREGIEIAVSGRADLISEN